MAHAVLNDILDGAIFDSSDEDEQATPMGRQLRDLLDPLTGYSDQDIYDRYRFYPPVLLEIVDMVQDQLTRPTRRNRPLAPLHQTCIALRYLASNSFQRVCGDTFQVNKSTACRALWRFCKAIMTKLNDFIRLPGSAEQQASKSHFYEMHNFPGVVGLIDGTHVRIIPPSENEEAFVNRKGFHSINVQVVVDHTGAFVSLNTDLPGRAHDARVLRSTPDLVDWLCSMPNGGHLLGDSGYPCTTYLLIPYRAPATPAQIRFNAAHRKTSIYRANDRKMETAIFHSTFRNSPYSSTRRLGYPSLRYFTEHCNSTKSASD